MDRRLGEEGSIKRILLRTADRRPRAAHGGREARAGVSRHVAQRTPAPAIPMDGGFHGPARYGIRAVLGADRLPALVATRPVSRQATTEQLNIRHTGT